MTTAKINVGKMWVLDPKPSSPLYPEQKNNQVKINIRNAKAADLS